MKYRKKAIEVEAFRLLPLHLSAVIRSFPSWFTSELSLKGCVEVIPNSRGYIDYVVIKTLEGEMKASVGDYIIKGVKGELYPCKGEIFSDTYEPCKEE